MGFSRRVRRTVLSSVGVAVAAVCVAKSPDSVSLAGRWQFGFDAKAQFSPGAPLSDTISLPTTTDVAGKGTLNPIRGEAWKLTRKHPYIGVAWYRRAFSLPEGWQGKRLWLSLERTKANTVFIDGRAIGESNALSTAQTFDLGVLGTGPHTLTLRVDNRLERWPDRVSASHMLEESTQTNWNGALGRIDLRADGDATFEGVTTAAGDTPRTLRVRANLLGRPQGRLTVWAYDGVRKIAQVSTEGTEAMLDFGPDAKFWDEFSPKLYRLEATVDGASWTGMVGLRRFETRDASFLVNGRRTFLRGKHDACVFPLTGHPPMDPAGWDCYFKVCKAYGINHVRFHSWCPPEAAFASADRMGVYLQPELPFWGDPSKPGVEKYLVEEGKRILRAYGSHPSFAMLSLGNEYWGDAPTRARMTAALRPEDPSRLYAQGSNSESWNPHEFPSDDYRVSAYIKPGPEGEGRGSYALADKRQGYIIAGTHGTLHTYSAALAGAKLPFVSHEVGQYQTYPNFREAPKYTGVLRPDNFAVFRDRLTKAGMLHQADAFVQASGRLSALLYREEIEAALRTPEMDGFQLLDLQDYPGQGTALVGMLDAFMNSKGLVRPEDWRAFCGPVVPLALFPKYTWRSNEVFTAEVRVANYGPSAIATPVRWRLSDGTRTLNSGAFAPKTIPAGGVTTIGSLTSTFANLPTPAKLTLALNADGKSLSWPVWFYGEPATVTPAGVTVASKLDDETLARLAHGERVVLFPKAADLPGSIPGDFATDFWNYPMFKGGNPPGTLGYLIQDKHPALAEFPTESHSDWQWQNLAHHSRTVILDAFPGLRPIVQTIDNVDRNHRLGTIFEAKVGTGKLLVCTIDLRSMTDAPEAGQLLWSLFDYVGSPHFEPAASLDGNALRKALHG